MKNEISIEEARNSATIYQFFHNPYGVVRAGTYKPSVVDCMALVCDSLFKCYAALWDNICQISFHMSIAALFKWLLLLPLWILIVVPLPFTFPLWGIFVYCRMRGERERYLKQQAEIDKLI